MTRPTLIEKIDFSKRSALAKKNGGILDLRPGERVRDGDGDVATFVSYGENEPLYVNLRYSENLRVRLPNSELKRVR